MSENNYAALQSNANRKNTSVEEVVPAGVWKQIRNAWIAGIVATIGTLVIGFITMSNPEAGSSYKWQALELVFFIAMTFGIYKKSRVCAVLMLMYFVVAKVTLLIMGYINIGGLVTGLAFLYFYIQGVRGTFAYHEWKRAPQADL